MSEAQTPEVLWAQRSSASDPAKNFIYLTITVPDVQKGNLKLDIKSQSLGFAGHSDSLKRDYALQLEFYDEIDEKETKVNHTEKEVQLVLRKKELKQEYWPRLLKETKKQHFLKTDFDKWADEDEQEEKGEDDFSNMSGMGGMPGMGDGLGGIDFSKLGGGEGGMPDMSSMGGMGGMGDDDEGDDDDDDEMPGLEGDEEAKGESEEPAVEGKGKGKIEEIN